MGFGVPDVNLAWTHLQKLAETTGGDPVMPVVDGVARCEFNVSHRLYSAPGLAALVRDCGFRSVETYGSLAGSPYDDKAEHLVAVARR